MRTQVDSRKTSACMEMSWTISTSAISQPMWSSKCHFFCWFRGQNCQYQRTYYLGIILTCRGRARWLLPSLEIIWGVVTFAQSRATNVTQLYVARFFIGALEAPVFAGTHFILGEAQFWKQLDQEDVLTISFQGSWYSGPELFKRAGMWFICNPLGSMISGYLQAAAYTNLSGVGGMPGWR